MKLKLTLACNLYDRTVDLLTGSIAPQGIDLNYLVMNVGEIFRRQGRHAEFDVAEMSLSTYAILQGQEDHRLIAIPVFPSRRFRHSDIFINTRAGINGPKDLVGKRVGSAEYQQTAGIWQRGLLQHDFDVRYDQVEWYFGPTNAPNPNYTDRVPFKLPAGMRTKYISGDQCLDRMLDEGEIDALLTAGEPPSFQRGSPNVGRLFSNYQEVETEYYRKSGIFPIMHMVVLKRSVYEKSPWIAMSLYEAFVKAKAEAVIRQRPTHGPLYSMLPWSSVHFREMDALMGTDPFVYGLDEQNCKNLATFMQYSNEQGLIPRQLMIEELFAPETLDTRQKPASPIE